MTAAVLRRSGQALAALWVASALVWSMFLIMPGDPALRQLRADNVPHPTEAQLAEQRERMGLDGSPVTRYGRWLTSALRGDLGESWSSGRPVTAELSRRLPATLILTGTALSLALGAALLLGSTAAYARGRWPDAAVRTVTLAFSTLPSFVLAVFLLDVVVVRWGLFRVVADGTWSTVLLPAVTLALAPAAAWARLLRAGVLEAWRAPSLRVATARGADRRRLLIHHALPNALVPFLTVVGTGVAVMFAGAAIVETIYSWPGIGRYAVSAIRDRDLPVVQGFTLLAVTIHITVSFTVDVVAAALDPRLRTARRAPSPRPER